MTSIKEARRVAARMFKEGFVNVQIAEVWDGRKSYDVTGKCPETGYEVTLDSWEHCRERFPAR